MWPRGPLQVFVHISTAFSQCVHEHVEERFYTPSVDPFELIRAIEQESRMDEFEIMAKKIIEPWPNTYAFTKSLAEEVVHRYKTKLPIAVVRPSIGKKRFRIDNVALEQRFDDTLPLVQ